MNFCSQCGARVELRIPDGDNLPRYVCRACATIHYQNPRVIVGCIPEYDGRILLCRRAIEPRLGYWTFPAGFMENGESLEAGAARECWEEAMARVDIGSLVAVVTVVHAEQVHMMFRARLLRPEFAPGRLRAAPLPRGPRGRPGAPARHPFRAPDRPLPGKLRSAPPVAECRPTAAKPRPPGRMPAH